MTSRKIQVLNVGGRVKKGVVNKPAVQTTKEIITLARWKSLLFECARKQEPEVAIKTLAAQNANFNATLARSPNDLDLLKYAIRTPSLSLARRQWAANQLLAQFKADKKPPEFLIVKNNWDHFSSHMTPTMRDLVQSAIHNSLESQSKVISRDGVFDKSDQHDVNNTVVIYINPTCFASNEQKNIIPNTAVRLLFDSIVQVLYDDGLFVLPLVNVLTNVLPHRDFQGYPTVSYHTIGRHDKVLHVKSAYIENYTYLDQTGYGPFADVPSDEQVRAQVAQVDPALAEEFYQENVAPMCEQRVSIHHQRDDGFELVAGKKHYFYAMQMVDDTVMRAAHIPQFDAIKTILDHFAKTDKILLLKKHPKDASQVTAEFFLQISLHPNCKVVSGNVHDLIAQTSATICINSGVGMEALMHLKPVISLGKSDYQAATYPARTKEELIALLDAEDLEVDVEFRKKFLWYFCNHHLCRADDKSSIRRKLAYLGVLGED